MDLLDRMLGHDRWTTARLLELSRGLSDEQLDQPFELGHRTVRATFVHMIAAVEVWNAGMSGQPHDMRDDERSLTRLIADHEGFHAVFAALSRQMHDEGRLDDTFLDYHGWPQSFGATILNVAIHNARHRGEVLHMLQRLGVPNLPDGDPLEWEHQLART